MASDSTFANYQITHPPTVEEYRRAIKRVSDLEGQLATRDAQWQQAIREAVLYCPRCSGELEAYVASFYGDGGSTIGADEDVECGQKCGWRGNLKDAFLHCILAALGRIRGGRDD